jgi:hypothetical protein
LPQIEYLARCAKVDDGPQARQTLDVDICEPVQPIATQQRPRRHHQTVGGSVTAQVTDIIRAF